MKILRGIVLTIAVAYFLSFVLNVRSFGWSSQHGFHSESYQGWHRFGALVFSAFLGAWYYGLKMWKLWAWWLGTILFGVGIVQILIDVFGLPLHQAGPFDTWWGVLSEIGSAGLVFVAYWKWWRCKRAAFQKVDKEAG
jgi:hypothetical protein